MKESSFYIHAHPPLLKTTVSASSFGGFDPMEVGGRADIVHTTLSGHVGNIPLKYVKQSKYTLHDETFDNVLGSDIRGNYM